MTCAPTAASPGDSPRLITYCTNIHPAESWQETFAALREHVPKVKRAVSPSRPFPIGLRLSARAAAELSAVGTAPFADWLLREECYVPTINGFPYGDFCGKVVKRGAYLPDWHSGERSDYTIQLADLLCDLLPEGGTGSISTVPVSFRSVACFDEHRERLGEVLSHLARLRQEKGRDIVLALEPEPGCLLETSSELVRFLDRMSFPGPCREQIGICLDCCHHALQFEEPAQALGVLRAGGVRIAKVQVSSALTARHEERLSLNQFVEQRYLHQVVVKSNNGALFRYDDLPDALQSHLGEAGDEWRCHFHVPIHLERAGEFRTTRSFIEQILPLLERELLLEVETYTWEVLPPHLRSSEVSQSIITEIRWLSEFCDAADRRP